MDRWRNGEVRWALGTSCLTTGLDYPHVRYVLFVELPYSLEQFVQGAGRAGRDGKRAEITVIFSSMEPPNRQREEDIHAGVEEMIGILNRKWLCRRALLSTFYDDRVVNCFGIPNAQLCDLCEAAKVSLLPGIFVRIRNLKFFHRMRNLLHIDGA